MTRLRLARLVAIGEGNRFMPFESKKADNSSQLFKRAAELHRKGNLSVAERLYLKILKARPDQFEVLHLLGILRHQQGRFTEALTSYDKALRIKPHAADTLAGRFGISPIRKIG